MMTHQLQYSLPRRLNIVAQVKKKKDIKGRSSGGNGGGNYHVEIETKRVSC